MQQVGDNRERDAAEGEGRPKRGREDGGEQWLWERKRIRDLGYESESMSL